MRSVMALDDCNLNTILASNRHSNMCMTFTMASACGDSYALSRAHHLIIMMNMIKYIKFLSFSLLKFNNYSMASQVWFRNTCMDDQSDIIIIIRKFITRT